LTWLLGLLSIVVILGHFRGYAHQAPGDFSAFYCAGQSVLHRADPYLVEPELSCETRLGVAFEGKVVLPAPLPAYDFVPFVLLAKFAPRIAALLYAAAMLAAMAIIAYCVKELAGLPLGVAAAIATIGISYDSVDWGQLAPFAVAAIAVAALLLRRNRPVSAGVVLCLGLMQPQFGLPAVISTWLCVKRSRRPIVISVLVLIAAALAAVGIRGLAEYPKVLALQSQAEVYWVSQYSLTWLVHALGGGVRTALAAGSASYIVLVVASLLAVYRYRRQAIATSAVVFLPATAAVLGGSFIHDYQIKVALAAAVVIFARMPLGLAPAIAIGLLYMPFGNAVHAFKLTELPSIVAALGGIWATVYFLSRDNARKAARTRATIAAAVAFAYYVFFAVVTPHQPVVASLAGQVITHNATALASQEYLYFMDHFQRLQHVPTLFLILLKLPLWIGLIVLLTSALRNLDVGGPEASLAEPRGYAMPMT